ncbi:hypothetical protein DSLASN_45430 [Desulfoluna limicola]|uniref:Uncharacterized protein n=1 Tax=Desulfoluna limicola TaxID=2810562 RepID=A0ABN6FAP0_9BACT|nr:hypothetical protein DSLASN_45430 [Desulfoluna limicola]
MTGYETNFLWNGTVPVFHDALRREFLTQRPLTKRHSNGMPLPFFTALFSGDCHGFNHALLRFIGTHDKIVFFVFGIVTPGLYLVHTPG